MRPHSTPTLPTVTDGPRVLRIRGSSTLVDALLPAEPGEAARFQVTARETWHLDEGILVEVSFGPLADEVTLRGTICAIHEQAGAADRVEVGIAKAEEERVAYVKQILDGHREASARRHRRVAVDIDVRWSCDGDRYASRARDLSRGGAFIASRNAPPVGARVDVEIRPPHQGEDLPPLRLGAVVSWVRGEGKKAGFGVRFKLQNRAIASRLHDVVRACGLAGANSQR